MKTLIIAVALLISSTNALGMKPAGKNMYKYKATKKDGGELNPYQVAKVTPIERVCKFSEEVSYAEKLVNEKIHKDLASALFNIVQENNLISSPKKWELDDCIMEDYNHYVLKMKQDYELKKDNPWIMYQAKATYEKIGALMKITYPSGKEKYVIKALHRFKTDDKKPRTCLIMFPQDPKGRITF